MRTSKTTLFRLSVCVLGGVLLLSGTALAGREEDQQKREALSGLGLDFERALVQSGEARSVALESVRSRLDALLDKGVPKESRSAALLLSGDVYTVLDSPDLAAEAYNEAVKKSGDSPYRDDAAFALIEALEAQGRHVEADKECERWLEEYPESPLAGEVRISQAWSALRRDSLSMAGRVLQDIRSRHPWLAGDPRVVLADGVLAFAEGRYADIKAEPTGGDLDAAILYLRAIAEIELDQPIKAAARFQTLIESHPESDLRDRAMLAKANIFLTSKAYRSAVEEFERVIADATDPAVVAEARLRRAAAIYLEGDVEGGVEALQDVAARHGGSTVAARAQMMLGEALVDAERYEEAIVEFNRVLTQYFEHELAAGAQYRVGRCFTALGRDAEATGAYQAVVQGYPTSREAPAAAYLAGVGLMAQERYRSAAPYFQIVLDRYARDPGDGRLEFATPERQELVEASLCLQEVAYYRAGDLGMLSGVPHVMLHRMPASKSNWRAWALLIDADALASQGRYDESQASLKILETEFPQHPAAPPALQLLAWIYAQQGEDELAITTQDRLLSKYGSSGAAVSTAVLNRAHILFNEKKYEKAAAEYEAFIANNPESESRPLAIYQAGICYLRLERDGDAVDRFDMLTAENPTDAIAEQAWLRAGDVYFRAAHYEEARRCYEGLLENFAGTSSAALGLLRIAQCDYNAGQDAEAIAGFSRVTEEYPDHPLAEEARKGIEQALYRLGQSGEGEETLASLVEQFPSSTFAADAQFEIAARRYDAQDWAGAAEAFRRVVTQFPDYSSADRAQYLMADALRRSGDEEAAKRAYDQFATFFPNSELITEVRLQVGANHFEKGDYMNAAIEFSNVLEDSASTPDIRAAALYNLALCRRLLEDTAGAQEALEEYVKKYPGDERAADVHYQLAEVYSIEERTQDAATHYLKSLEADADPLLKAELYYRLGEAREKLGDIDGAVRAYAGARRQDDRSNPFRLTAIVRLAAIYEERSETDKAIKMYKDLIKNATDDEVVVAAKARVDELEAAAKR